MLVLGVGASCARSLWMMARGHRQEVAGSADLKPRGCGTLDCPSGWDLVCADQYPRREAAQQVWPRVIETTLDAGDLQAVSGVSLKNGYLRLLQV